MFISPVRLGLRVGLWAESQSNGRTPAARLILNRTLCSGRVSKSPKGSLNENLTAEQRAWMNSKERSEALDAAQSSALKWGTLMICGGGLLLAYFQKRGTSRVLTLSAVVFMDALCAVVHL